MQKKPKIATRPCYKVLSQYEIYNHETKKYETFAKFGFNFNLLRQAQEHYDKIQPNTPKHNAYLNGTNKVIIEKSDYDELIATYCRIILNIDDLFLARKKPYISIVYETLLADEDARQDFDLTGY